MAFADGSVEAEPVFIPISGACYMSRRLPWGLRWRLSVLWLLEWGVSGAILTFLPIYWKSIGVGEAQQGQLYAIAALGLWVAPFLVGQVADRWMAADRYLVVSHFIGGVTLYLLAAAGDLYKQTGGKNFALLMTLCGIHSIAYFPTVPLVSALCFRHLSDPNSHFGKVRIWGTVGWMLAGAALSVWLGRDDVMKWVQDRYAQAEFLPTASASEPSCRSRSAASVRSCHPRRPRPGPKTNWLRSPS
jgi:hypothetical protein